MAHAFVVPLGTISCELIAVILMIWLHTTWFLRTSVTTLRSYISVINMNFSPGRKCKALRLGVHLILSYFTWISLLTTKTFFYYFGGGRLAVEGGRCPTFLVFNFLYKYTIYTLDIGVYRYIQNIFMQNNFLVGLIFSTSWRVSQLSSKSNWWDDFFKNGF